MFEQAKWHVLRPARGCGRRTQPRPSASRRWGLWALVLTLWPQSSPAASPPKTWWQSLDDRALQSHVERAQEANPDLHQARLAVLQAQATAQEMLIALRPTVSARGSMNLGPLRSLGFQFGAGRQGQADMPLLYINGSAALEANMRFDLGGRDFLQRDAARLDVKAQRISAEQQQEALALQVVTTYLDVVTARAQLQVMQTQVQTVQELMRATLRRVQLAESSAVDVLTQKQQLARVQAQIPLAQLQLRAFLTQLARLRGEAPGKPYPSASELDPKRWLDVAVPQKAPTPQSRRQVQAAKQKLEVARIRQKAANRSWAPSLTLNGQGGIQGMHIDAVRTQEFWQLGLILNIPIYQGGRVRNQRAQAKIRSEQASAELARQTLDAQQRWANLQDQLRLRQENLAALERQQEAAATATQESQQRYLSGVSTYSAVLNNLNALTAVQLQVITAQRDLIAVALSIHSFHADASPGALPPPSRSAS